MVKRVRGDDYGGGQPQGAPGSSASTHGGAQATRGCRRVRAKVINQILYTRSHERFTWKGVLCPHPDRMKRTRILPHARSRDKSVPGSCVYYSVTTALEAANRGCGVEVGELAWEELYALVSQDNPDRTSAALRALKYRGIHNRSDYVKGEFNSKRFKISQFCKFYNIENIHGNVLSGLDRNNMKAAIDNMLSKSVILAHFPISYNYLDLEDSDHIYAFDKDDAILQTSKDGPCISTHLVVVTGFGFEEQVPYFEFLDCNGKSFGKKGFGRISPNSIISLYAFDIILD